MEYSKPNDNGWHYDSDGNRLGPVSTTEIVDKISDGKLSRSTLVWNEGWGNEQDWQPAKNTLLIENVQVTGPPPLPANNINNTFAWALVGVQVVGTLIETILHQSIDGFSEKWYLVLIAYFIVNSVIAIKDADNIKKSGNKENVGFWFWLIPVYLYKRAKSLKQSLNYFWSWIGVFVVSMIIMGMAESSDTYWGVGTPPCSSPAVVSLAKEIFNDIPAARAQGIRSLDLRDISAINSTNDSRSCQAILAASDTHDYVVEYEVTDQGDDFYVKLEVLR